MLVFHKSPIGRRARPGLAADAIVARSAAARRDHEGSMERLRAILDRLAVTARWVPLTRRVRSEGYDLVVALGGDGTVLHASHAIGDTPVLALNSSPRHSVGFLTAAPVDGAEELIARALTGDLPRTKLQRMAVDIDGRRAYGRVLNDVLFTHECPASTARYVIGLGEVRETQMSSGIWVGPAAGSTAAQRAAGGRVLPPRSRRIQFVVREPYLRHGVPYELARGLVPPGRRLEVRSMMDAARLYVDGPHVVFPVRLGESVALTLSEEPLELLGFRGAG